jgi:hypothetical protein
VSGEPGVSDVYGMAIIRGVPEMKVILLCPECNRKRLYDYDEWVRSCHPLAKAHQRIRCTNDRCFNQPIMLFDRDVSE